jgi:hypothetical protein
MKGTTRFSLLTCLSTLGINKSLLIFRGYSTGSIGRGGHNNSLSKILHSVYTNNAKNYVSNEVNQIAIEELVFDQYATLFTNYKGYSMGDINTSLLTGRLKEYILDKGDELTTRVKDLQEYYVNIDNKSNKKKEDIFIGSVVSSLDTNFILNLCLLHFIIISSYQNTEDKDKFYSINVAMDIGRKMMRKYLYILKCSDIAYKYVSYST